MMRLSVIWDFFFDCVVNIYMLYLDFSGYILEWKSGDCISYLSM